MAQKRILNKTPRTLILTYDKDKFIKLKRHSVTSPLPESHPIFLETSLGTLEYKGLISILSDSEYNSRYSAIKQQLLQKEVSRKTEAEKIVENAKKIKEAEEHNRKVKIKKTADELIKRNTRGEATADTLIEEKELQEVEVPKSIEKTKPEEPVTDLKVASVPDASSGLDPDYVADKVEKAAKKTKKRGRPRKKKTEPTVEPTETTDESTDNTEEFE
jgi:hypothetical protein